MKQSKIDAKNANFWSELCGTQLANHIGIVDDTPSSLKKFDDWFFNFYPYVSNYIDYNKMPGKKVLEIGLGYGSISQKLMEHGADFHCLDISSNPVEFSKHRANLLSSKINAKVGSVLQIPFEENYFDYVISIGCIHHTGNIRKSINEIYRTLKPGGMATIMIYNLLSCKQFIKKPFEFIRNFLFPREFSEKNVSDNDRKQYDTNSKKSAAPYTQFTSKKQIRSLLNDFSDVTIKTENMPLGAILRMIPRNKALKFGKYFGTDIYANAIK